MSQDILNFDADKERESDVERAVTSDRKTAALFKEVFGTDAGAQVLKRMDSFCFVNASTFSADNRDAVIFREGMRNVALWVHAWLAYERELANPQEPK